MEPPLSHRLRNELLDTSGKYDDYLDRFLLPTHRGVPSIPTSSVRTRQLLMTNPINDTETAQTKSPPLPSTGKLITTSSPRKSKRHEHRDHKEPDHTPSLSLTDMASGSLELPLASTTAPADSKKTDTIPPVQTKPKTSSKKRCTAKKVLINRTLQTSASFSEPATDISLSHIDHSSHFHLKKKLDKIRQVVQTLNKKTGALHPYGTLTAERRLPFSASTVDDVLYLTPPRTDLDLNPDIRETLWRIRRAAGVVCGDTYSDDLVSGTGYFSSGDINVDKSQKISRQELQGIPLTADVSKDLVQLTSANLNSELQLSCPPNVSSFGDFENTAKWLRDVRKSARAFVTEAIQEPKNHAATAVNAYAQSEPLNLLKVLPDPASLLLADRDIGQQPSFYVHLVQECWMELLTERIANVSSFNFSKSLIETAVQLYPQVYLSHTIPHVAKTSHFFFTALVESRIPGILRLLARLNAPLFFETRINISGYIGSARKPLEQALLNVTTTCDALRYNIEGLRIMWPFLFETPDVNLPVLLSSFLESRLCNSILALLTYSPPEQQQTVLLLRDFLRFLADTIVSVHNTALVEQIIYGSPKNTTEYGGRIDEIPQKRAIKPSSSLASRNKSLIEKVSMYLGNSEYNIFVVNECVTLIADFLYLSASDHVRFPEAIITILIQRVERQYNSCRERRKTMLDVDPVWFTVEKKTAMLLQEFHHLALDEEMNRASLFELTTCFQFYCRSRIWPFNIRQLAVLSDEDETLRQNENDEVPMTYEILRAPSPPISVLFEVFRSPMAPPNVSPSFSPSVMRDSPDLQLSGVGYVIPCWREGCSNVLREWDIESGHKTFHYCRRSEL